MKVLCTRFLSKRNRHVTGFSAHAEVNLRKENINVSHILTPSGHSSKDFMKTLALLPV